MTVDSSLSMTGVASTDAYSSGGPRRPRDERKRNGNAALASQGERLAHPTSRVGLRIPVGVNPPESRTGHDTEWATWFEVIIPATRPGAKYFGEKIKGRPR